jgi:hypothetical protein
VVETPPVTPAASVQVAAPQPRVAFVAVSVTLTPFAGAPVSPSSARTEKAIAAGTPTYDPFAGFITTCNVSGGTAAALKLPEAVPPPALADSVTAPTLVGVTLVETLPVASAVIVQLAAPQAPSVAFPAETVTLAPAAAAPVSPSATCTANGIAAVRPA